VSDAVIAVAAGIGAMVGWGCADFLAKLGVDRIGSVPALVWAHLCGALLMVLAVAARDIIASHPVDLPSSPRTWVELTAFGAGQAAVYLLLYRGFERGRLSVLNPIFSTYAGIAALAAILFFGDALSVGQGIAVIVIFCGVLFLSFDAEEGAPRRIGGTPGLREVGAATVLAGCWTILWDQMVSDSDWWTLTALMYVLMAGFLLLAAWATRTRLSVPPRDLRWILIGIGAAEVAAYLSLSVGLAETALTSVVVLLSGAFPIIAIALGHRFLSERLARIQLVGAAIVILGTSVVVLAAT
jgi:drug/metabolite transporter (DMT)-like permease